jgi:hypothetical protein
MPKADVQLLRNQMREAHNDFVAFMDTFVFEEVVGNTPPRTPEDQARVLELYRRKQELEERWINAVWSPEPVEQD